MPPPPPQINPKVQVVEFVEGDPNKFLLVAGDHRLHFKASTIEEKQKWIRYLRSSILSKNSQNSAKMERDTSKGYLELDNSSRSLHPSPLSSPYHKRKEIDTSPSSKEVSLSPSTKRKEVSHSPSPQRKEVGPSPSAQRKELGPSPSPQRKGLGSTQKEFVHSLPSLLPQRSREGSVQDSGLAVDFVKVGGA